jgi:hypothetical protein
VLAARGREERAGRRGGSVGSAGGGGWWPARGARRKPRGQRGRSRGGPRGRGGGRGWQGAASRAGGSARPRPPLGRTVVVDPARVDRGTRLSSAAQLAAWWCGCCSEDPDRDGPPAAVRTRLLPATIPVRPPAKLVASVGGDLSRRGPGSPGAGLGNPGASRLKHLRPYRRRRWANRLGGSGALCVGVPRDPARSRGRAAETGRGAWARTLLCHRLEGREGCSWGSSRNPPGGRDTAWHARGADGVVVSRCRRDRRGPRVLSWEIVSRWLVLVRIGTAPVRTRQAGATA